MDELGEVIKEIAVRCQAQRVGASEVLVAFMVRTVSLIDGQKPQPDVRI